MPLSTSAYSVFRIQDGIHPRKKLPMLCPSRITGEPRMRLAGKGEFISMQILQHHLGSVLFGQNSRLFRSGRCLWHHVSQMVVAQTTPAFLRHIPGQNRHLRPMYSCNMPWKFGIQWGSIPDRLLCTRDGIRSIGGL